MDDIRPASEASVANRVLRLPLAAAAGVVRAVGRAASGAWGFAGSVLSIPRLKLGTAELHVEAHRNDGNDAAIVLVHGFGACNRTWGDLPALLKREPAVDGWDIYSVGYDTAFIPDVRGLWSADPDIATLATYVRSRLRLEPSAATGRWRWWRTAWGASSSSERWSTTPRWSPAPATSSCTGRPAAAWSRRGWARS
ncbi:MAG: hypothetical protein R2726_06885 [Acidimicrobiales bacterium]